jgi:hypothetical protein
MPQLSVNDVDTVKEHVAKLDHSRSRQGRLGAAKPTPSAETGAGGAIHFQGAANFCSCDIAHMLDAEGMEVKTRQVNSRRPGRQSC